MTCAPPPDSAGSALFAFCAGSVARWIAALLLVGAGASHAGSGQGAVVDAVATKAQIERRHQEAVTACHRQFAVNDCLQKAQAARQQALQPLQDAEVAESLAQREQRASESRARIRQKAQDHAALESQRRSAALMAPPVPAPVPAALRPPAPAASRAVRTGPAIEQQRARDEAAAARRAEDLQARIQKSEAHRREIEKRLQERARQKPQAAPLPPPVSGPQPASAGSAPR